MTPEDCISLMAGRAGSLAHEFIAELHKNGFKIVRFRQPRTAKKRPANKGFRPLQSKDEKSDSR